MFSGCDVKSYSLMTMLHSILAVSAEPLIQVSEIAIEEIFDVSISIREEGWDCSVQAKCLAGKEETMT